MVTERYANASENWKEKVHEVRDLIERGTFSWSSTPQGSTYWSDVSKNLFDIATEPDSYPKPSAEDTLKEIKKILEKAGI